MRKILQAQFLYFWFSLLKKLFKKFYVEFKLKNIKVSIADLSCEL